MMPNYTSRYRPAVIGLAGVLLLAPVAARATTTTSTVGTPFIEALSCSVHVAGECDASVTVPKTLRWVIKTFTGFCIVRPYSDLVYEIYLETTVKKRAGAVFATPTVVGGVYNSFTQNIETYADPGTTVSFHAFSFASEDLVLSCSAYLSGLAVPP